MSTTADKLNYLISTKNAIKQAIIDKGVDVSDTDTFRSYADKIVDIQAGSTGGDYDIEVTLNDDGTQSLNVIDAIGEKTNKFLQLIEGTENVSLTAQDFGDITEIRQYAFAYATNLISVVLPNTITSLGDYAFSNCSNLTSVTFEENSQLTSINSYAFYGCSSLTSIEISNSVTSIRDYAFDSCRGLTSITFGENSKLASIGSSAFQYCRGLTSITIPEGVTSIGNYAFWSCSSLTTMTVLPTTPPALSSTNVIYSATTSIYVPDESVSAYQSATNWSNFANIIKPLSEKESV